MSILPSSGQFSYVTWVIPLIILLILGYIFERQLGRLKGEVRVSIREELKQGNPSSSRALGIIGIILFVLLGLTFIQKLLFNPSSFMSLSSFDLLLLILLIGSAVLIRISYKSKRVTPVATIYNDNLPQK